MIIILTADREHVVDLLPHLWVLDGVLITGKKKFSIIYTYCTFVRVVTNLLLLSPQHSFLYYVHVNVHTCTYTPVMYMYVGMNCIH